LELQSYKRLAGKVQQTRLRFTSKRIEFQSSNIYP